jgi:thioredoxin reductase (NADPH)
MEEANFLANITNSVTVVHRRDMLRASKIMQERATANPKIRFIWDSAVKEITGDDKVTGVQLHNLKSGKDSHVKAEGVFVAIGYEPNTGFLKGKIELDSQGYVVTRKETETSVPGVFAAGDVRDHKYRQAITAAADGCKAAIDADRFLAEHSKI